MSRFYKTLNKAAYSGVSMFIVSTMFLSPVSVGLVYADDASSTPEAVTDQSTDTASDQSADTTNNDTSGNTGGTDGTSGSGDSTSEDGAVIVTGDAVAGSDTETAENTNISNTNVSSSTPEANTQSDNASSSDEVLPEDASSTQEELASTTLSELNGTSTPEVLSSTSTSASSTPGSLTSSTTNNGIASTTVDVNAGTGDNSATGNNSTIASGDAIAYANIINVVNTNIVNSQGFIDFLNQILGLSTIDLRSAFASVFTNDPMPNSTSPCSLQVCGSDTTLNVTNQNNATTTNNVNVTANTGGNTAGDGGLILSGNAYAAANVFNVANTNITDSNYLVISFNNFGDFGGDIVLPTGDTLESLFGGGVSGYPNANVSNTNTASVSNNVSSTADTGGNTAGGEGVIATGDASANTSVQNVVNTNLLGGGNFMIVLRVLGDWNGDIFGLPDGISWKETDNGIVLYRSAGGTGAPLYGNLDVNNTNNASIENNVSVYALTGKNKVGDSGVVGTGNAYSAANVTNIVNTNVLGQNWGLLVFNILGNWNGSLAFGQPDLWVGTTAKADSERNWIRPGDDVTYTYTIMNRGDADATNVVLSNTFNNADLVPVTKPDSLVHSGDLAGATWNLGTIKAGQAIKLAFKASVGNTLPKDSLTPLTVGASVTSHEHDADMADNTDTITLYSGYKRGTGLNVRRSFPSNLEITKTSDVTQVEPGGVVNYTVSVTNHGGVLYHSMLKDLLQDPSGAVISEQDWNIGTIGNDETVNVTYGLQFSPSSTPGVYTNSAGVSGYDMSSSIRYARQIQSDVVSHLVTVGELGTIPGLATTTSPAPIVLSASTICHPLLDSYLRPGANNDPIQVELLQGFLRDMEGMKEVKITGTFDIATEAAVRAFQNKYADEILGPWGAGTSTGFVYYTTQKKINEIYCDGENFPLTEAQLKQIALTKKRAETAAALAANAILNEPAVVRREDGQPDDVASSNNDAKTPEKPILSLEDIVPDKTITKSSWSLSKLLEPFTGWFNTIASAVVTFKD